jgi:dimethylamine/trimethylamine dehydrogenase
MDFIGAARPSIADPFLPRKIEEGRPEDIRECIGCNICVSGNNTFIPMRCTQNPVVGEEWRRGWHPEVMAPKGSDDKVLIVGGGAAGLETARALGRRGYQVTLAERDKVLGGRLNWESTLPGLAAWARVRDWRVAQIQTMANVEVFLDSFMDADTIRAFGAPHVVLATGSNWRRDGIGHHHHHALPGAGASHVFGPEDVIAGRVSEGPVVVFDDDHMYLGGLIAEKLALDGLDVTLVTTASEVSSFTVLTLEQDFVQRRLRELGVTIAQQTALAGIDKDEAELACVFTGTTRRVPAAAVVLVTSRLPNEVIYLKLAQRPELLEAAGVKSLAMIGDCHAPGLIAAAVHDGHLYARDLDADASQGQDVPYRREHMTIIRSREDA